MLTVLLKSFRPFFMRIRNQKKKRIPKLSRALPYPGKPIEQYEHSKLYKCWYCGHVNTVGREAYDEGKSGMFTTLGMSYTPSRGARDGALGALSVPRDIFRYRVAPQAGADGTAKVVKNEWTVVRHQHCAACGTATWGPGAGK